MNYNNSKAINNIYEDTFKELEFYNVLAFVSKYCLSEQGKELIMSAKPNEDLFWLRLEHELIEEMKEIMTTDEPIPLSGVDDIRKLLNKSLIQNAILSAAEILSVLDVIRSSRYIRNSIKQREETYPNISELISMLFENKILEKHISDAIDDTGAVRDNASRELLRIRMDIAEKSARLRTRLQKLLRKVAEDELVQEDFFTLREGRFVLPIKSEHKRHLPGIIHGLSQTGATVYIEPTEIIEMNNDLSLLKNEEEREIARILQTLTEEIGSEANEIMRTTEVLAHLDAIQAKANYALEFAGIKPVIWEHNEISLRNIKHPLLAQTKGVNNVIPLSIEFSQSRRGHLISGPNAGGKTVALKSIGLNLILALSGIFPLGECSTNYRTVFSAIGDHQSIENDLSTFSSQMLQIKQILDECSINSVVLVDEIGSGTDPQEGAALASGILDTFLEINLFFVATTHQSSLKTYALTRDEIENASLEFNEEALKPTYKFLSGIPGNSYAFFLAKNIGLSDLVIERSKSYLGERHDEIEGSIAILQKYRAEAASAFAQSNSLKMKYSKLLKEYETRNSEIKLKRKEIIQKANEEAVAIVNNANALIENTVREIKEEKRALTEIKTDFGNEKKKLESKIKNAEKSIREKKAENEQLLPGDTVSIEDSPSLGSVIEVDYDDKMALVEFNGFKFRLPFDQLIKKQGKVKQKQQIVDYIKLDATTRIDVRGMRAEEAIRDIDEFISDAIMSNVDYLTIIHGKGTGALRKAIHDYLSYHPSISNFRSGDLVEGGDGVTVIKLRD